jgi:hypothetical protein
LARGQAQSAAKPECSKREMSASCRTLAEAAVRHVVSDVGRSRGQTRVGRWLMPRSGTLCPTLAEAAVRHAVTDVGRSRGQAQYAVTSDGVHAGIRAASFACTRAEAWERALPRSRDRGRSLDHGNEATLLDARCRSAEQPLGYSRGSGVCIDLPKRVFAGTVLPKAASHLGATEVDRGCKTRSGNPTTSPMGSGSFRRMNPGDRCTELPLRYRPLSEFLTPSAV